MVSILHTHLHQEAIPVKFFVEFLDYFGLFFDLNPGGHIDKSILPPEFGSKIGSKELKNRLKLFTWIASMMCPFSTQVRNVELGNSISRILDHLLTLQTISNTCRLTNECSRMTPNTRDFHGQTQSTFCQALYLLFICRD